MEKETNSNATASTHHDQAQAQGERRSTRAAATRASARIKDDIRVALKSKRRQACYLHQNNKTEQSRKQKEPTIPGEGVRSTHLQSPAVLSEAICQWGYNIAVCLDARCRM